MVLIRARGSDGGVMKDNAKFVRREKSDQEFPGGLADLSNDFGNFFLVNFVIGCFASCCWLPFVAELKDWLEVCDAEQLHLLGLADAQVVDEFLTQCQQDKLEWKP